MREIVRSVKDNNTQYAAVDWDNNNEFNFSIKHVESIDYENDLVKFHENIEWLYKKWLMGEEVNFTINFKELTWNANENLIPTIALQQEKNEYLAKKAQRKIQHHYNKLQFQELENEIKQLQDELEKQPSDEAVEQINAKAKELDGKIKQAVALTKNITLQQGIIKNGIDVEDFFILKPKLDEIFAKLKASKEDSYFTNYNILGAQVEALYAQSKVSDNYNDTRKEIIELQKKLFTANLNRWQKDELIARIRTSFDNINARQDIWRAQQNVVKDEQALQLQKKYEELIPIATAATFAEGFSMLKDLQQQTNVSNLSKEKREAFYQKLNVAFNTIKIKADEENDSNFEAANKHIETAITNCQNAELFKDGRVILTEAQNQLKEIRLSKKQKDELFGKIRVAFDELNKKQDEYFAQRKKEKNEHLETLLQTLKRALTRKEEGMEKLYTAKQNINEKTGMFRNTKKGTNELLNQFLERQTDIEGKIQAAEKDIEQLKKKIEKIGNEASEK